MTLNDIVQSAQGGQAIGNIASRFGLSPQRAQGAVNALLPAIQMGLQNTAANGGGLSSILQHLGNGAHQQSYVDPNAAQSPAATQAGGSVLGDIFGGHAATDQVAQQASAESGVATSVIQAMLPTLASVVMGGLFHGAQSGGFGGALQNMIGGAAGGGGGGFGSSLGGGPQAPPPAGQVEEGGLGGMIGNVLGGLFGGVGPDAAAPAPNAAPLPQGSDSDAALDRFSQMFQAGTPASPQHEASLANILGR